MRRKILSAVLMILFSVTVIAAVPTEAEANIYDDTVRLHILANSDSDVDQNIKLRVRDFVLSRFGERLRVFDSKELAVSELGRLIPVIERDVCEFLSSSGVGYGCSVTITEEWYSTREYEEFSLPCGWYSSLRIMLGEAKGHNWWCVMFPPLCLDMATSESEDLGYSEEESRLICGKYNIKFKFLELISESLKDLS